MTELAGRRLVRLRGPDGRVRVCVFDGPGYARELNTADALAALTDGAEPGDAAIEIAAETLEPLADGWTLVAPIDAPEVWCAGVTYERSRDARVEESRVQDVYSLVYDAERPELFLKDANGRRTVGPGEAIGVRSDSNWNVPEPEVAVVLGHEGAPLAVTIGNDVSSRDIEGTNPLYLPQAKVYARACSLGPALYVPDDWSRPFEIELRIRDESGSVVFEGATSTARMKRSFEELIAFLVRDNPVPAGSVLLTGTGLVPPDDFTLQPGHVVEIRVPPIGTLINPVAPASRKE